MVKQLNKKDVYNTIQTALNEVEKTKVIFTKGKSGEAVKQKRCL